MEYVCSPEGAVLNREKSCLIGRDIQDYLRSDYVQL